ncbi:MAG: hypothetical protein HY708_02305, partial [Ignavibacteriae bacterium]|nr:hypothetical protein [Ignavibacteriota bacterium]
LGLIADEFGNIVARRTVGASNPNVVGVDAAAKNLFTLISRCCEDIRCRPDDLGAVVLGLAGAGKNVASARVSEALNRLIIQSGGKPLPIAVESDARVALEGAFDGGSGVVIIAGTGSIVIGKTDRGAIVGVGGWGRLIGDEGSGYYIGREAVVAVTLHYDKRGDSGRLRDLFAEKLQWRSREDIITAIYQNKYDLSSLAPLVMEAAAGNDVVSQRILQKAAGHLADQAQVIVMQMSILRKVGLVMLGGLIEHNTIYADVLHTKLLKALPQVDIRPPMHSPAHGALRLAMETLKKK